MLQSAEETVCYFNSTLENKTPQRTVQRLWINNIFIPHTYKPFLDGLTLRQQNSFYFPTCRFYKTSFYIYFINGPYGATVKRPS